jgi:phosphatidylglycerophosphatase A
MKSRRKITPIPPGSVFGNPVCFLAFGLGSGLAPIAPGTFGTLAAVPLYLWASALQMPAYLALTLVLFVGGAWICGRCEQNLQAEDHSGIVLDEIVGFFIAMTGAPADLANLAVGFALFRVFDILKPWPIGLVDRRIRGGLGIMLDDAIAGVYVCLALFFLGRYLRG